MWISWHKIVKKNLIKQKILYDEYKRNSLQIKAVLMSYSSMLEVFNWEVNGEMQSLWLIITDNGSFKKTADQNFSPSLVVRSNEIWKASFEGCRWKLFNKKIARNSVSWQNLLSQFLIHKARSNIVANKEIQNLLTEESSVGETTTFHVLQFVQAERFTRIDWSVGSVWVRTKHVDELDHRKANPNDQQKFC